MGPGKAPARRRACAVAAALAVSFMPAARAHQESGGPLGPQALPDPAATVADAATADRCDPIDPSACLLPFPNDHFTTPDATTATGLRLNLSPLSMPRNIGGKPIDPTEWNRNDGFSPGQMAVTHVPGLDPAHTALPPVTNPRASLDAGSAVVAIDVRTGQRHPLWAELDQTVDGVFGGGTVQGATLPGTPPLYDPSTVRNLLIRPAVNWHEGDRYILVLRNLRDAHGAALPSSPVFAAYRDRTATPMGLFDTRRAHFEELFAAIAAHHGPAIDRAGIFLAWDFTVASERNLSERILHMRDDALASLAGGAPSFMVTSVTDHPGPSVLRRVRGTFLVPRYVSTTTPGAVMVYDPQTGLPLRQPTPQQPTFTCNIPVSAVDSTGGVHPTGVSLYGHGLLGSQDEVNSDAEVGMGALHNWTFCATDWIGLASEDLPVVAGLVIPDLSFFHLIPDRNQQAILDFLFLGRLLKDRRGFASDPAFRLGGRPLIDPTTLVYDGNSQGGIMGGAVTAVGTDFTRSVLGVLGMNYSTLLTRSSDYDAFAALQYPAYPDQMDRQLIMSLLQILWDRGEADGYAEHMTDHPYPGTPAHQVLLEAAFGDHQVTNYAAEVEAATIGAAAWWPAPRHHWGQPPYGWFSTIRAADTPYRGSALMEWDSGVPAPPLGNVPNRAAHDPHETPRRDPSVRMQMDAFWRTGFVVDACTGSSPDGTCQTVHRDGP